MGRTNVISLSHLSGREEHKMRGEPVKKRRHLANTLKCRRFFSSGSVATEHFMFLPASGNVNLMTLDWTYGVI